MNRFHWDLRMDFTKKTGDTERGGELSKKGDLTGLINDTDSHPPLGCR